MARKPSKHVKRRMALLGPLSIAVFIITLYTIVSTTYSINNLHQKKITLENDLKDLKKKQIILEEEVEKLKDPEYIAKYAREHYYYTKDGEYVIKYDEKEDKPSEKIKVNIKDYLPVGICLTSLPLFIYILLKNKK